MSLPRTDGPPPSDGLAARLTRTEVQRSGSSVPGSEIVQVLTQIPEGVESGWHTHPGEEVGYLLAGTVEMAVEGRPTSTLHAADGFLIPPRTRHDARARGPGRCCRATWCRWASHWPPSPPEPGAWRRRSLPR